MDLFSVFLAPLETALGVKSSYSIGKYHSISDIDTYKARIEAVNFALAHDDGIGSKNYGAADVVLFGVSRSGKTPTSLYLALQFGIKAANYPYTEEDMQSDQLPKILKAHKAKVFGLLINAERLHSIRSERRSGSQYASLANCRVELQELLTILRRENIPYLDATDHSIEELATKLLVPMGLKKRI